MNEWGAASGTESSLAQLAMLMDGFLAHPAGLCGAGQCSFSVLVAVHRTE